MHVDWPKLSAGLRSSALSFYRWLYTLSLSSVAASTAVFCEQYMFTCLLT